jgi:hypothetical protein
MLLPEDNNSLKAKLGDRRGENVSPFHQLFLSIKGTLDIFCLVIKHHICMHAKDLDNNFPTIIPINQHYMHYSMFEAIQYLFHFTQQEVD